MSQAREIRLAAAVLLLTASQTVVAADLASRTRFLMGTMCEITSSASPLVEEAAFEEIARVENLLSTWRHDTELARLNEHTTSSFPVGAELDSLLRTAFDWSRRTNGAFNPLVGSLVESWDARGRGRVPTEETLATALQLTSIDRIAQSPGSINLGGGIVEEGAFGKGYALDRAAEILDRSGSRTYVVDFGGQLAIRSETPLRVAIAHPEVRQHEALSLTVANGSVSTTSGSEKWFESPRGRLSHVIDPRTGEALPPRGSATVVHSSALVADILSTALYVMGPDQGIAWADANGVAAIFIVPDGERWLVFTSSEGNNPGFDLQTVDADFQLKGKP